MQRQKSCRFYKTSSHFGRVEQNNDRIFATLKCEKDLTPEQQIKLVNEFNTFIDGNRSFYGDLIFTNYRDNGRKRISLEDVYKICTKLLKI